MLYRSLLLALPAFLLPFQVLASSVDAERCQSNSPESSLSQCPRPSFKDDGFATLADGDAASFIQFFLESKQPSSVPATQPHAWKLLCDEVATVFTHIGSRNPHPGLDKWDTCDTVTVVSMLVVLLLFDCLVNPRLAHNVRNHAFALVFMLFASVVFCIAVWKQRGYQDGVAWLTGYIVEWALSLDNLFAFHLVFKAFSVPTDQSIRALSFGIYGAICGRLIFIVVLSELFKLHYIIDIVVGGMLIVSGILSLQEEEEEEVHNLGTVKFFKWLFGPCLVDRYDDKGRLFIRSDTGDIQMTLLFLVICVIAVVDCVFAVDSVGTKTGQIKNVYINVTSSLMAMFSLRSLFFIVKDVADYFEYVKYGICAILCFVGAEMIVSKWIPVPLSIMCVIIGLLFVGSVVLSALKVYSREASSHAAGKAENTKADQSEHPKADKATPKNNDPPKRRPSA